MTSKRIPCPATLDRERGRELFAQVQESAPGPGETLVLDFSNTGEMDTQGGAWLVRIADFVRKGQGELRWEGQGGRTAEYLELIEPGLLAAPPKPGGISNPLEYLGDTAFRVVGECRDALDLVFDALYWTVIAPIEGKGFRFRLMLDEIHEMGVRAIKVNCLMNFLLGLTIAMLSAAQIADLGLGIYVADLITIGFARELAALMTAIVVSARTGAAIAAELATMKVQEEIDALRGMGLHVPQFLVAPKLAAMVIVMPCLVAMGMIAGVLGGSIWGILVLGFEPAVWFRETLQAAQLDDVIQGLVKAFVFAVTIVLVGCHNGLRVTGGSRGVGLMTTRAVVMDIFFLVVFDMMFAIFFYYIL